MKTIIFNTKGLHNLEEGEQTLRPQAYVSFLRMSFLSDVMYHYCYVPGPNVPFFDLMYHIQNIQQGIIVNVYNFIYKLKVELLQMNIVDYCRYSDMIPSRHNHLWGQNPLRSNGRSLFCVKLFETQSMFKLSVVDKRTTYRHNLSILVGVLNLNSS